MLARGCACRGMSLDLIRETDLRFGGRSARIIDLEHFLRQTGLQLRIDSKGMLCRKMRSCGSS
jgi:hypothetical protein